MKIGIFYLSHTDGLNKQIVQLPSGGCVFIRIEEVDAASESDALDLAKLRDGEALMNTHTLERQ